MIRGMIFDLDGTLVKTEQLKAASYAQAAVKLSSKLLKEKDVIEAYKVVIGRSREEIASSMVTRFHLEQKAQSFMTELGVSSPWQVLLQMRLHIYESLISDPQVLRKNQWPYTTALLHEARQANCKIALATMSLCDQVQQILNALSLKNAFDYILTADDIERGKPDPQIYALAIKKMELLPHQCLVIEDSAPGVQAALAAGAWCIAVTTPFTREKMYSEKFLDEKWVVDDPNRLAEVVKKMVNERKMESRD